MADIGLVRRADCHASGTAEQYAAAVKGSLTIYLCAHHTNAHSTALAANGWRVVLLNVKEPVPA